MEMSIFDDDFNKVKSKEELIELLKEYRGILSEPMIDYLNSLIELEFSVIKEYISDSDRKALSELEVYKKIAIYNIYNRAQKLFNQQNHKIVISGNDDGIEGLRICFPFIEKETKLFDYDYRSVKVQSRIPDYYKTMWIGNVSLFQTIENSDQREAELTRIKNMLDWLRNEENPYSRGWFMNGGGFAHWAFEQNEKIRKYEKKFRQLSGKKALTDEEKKEIEITEQFHELLLKDYGLTNESFKEEKPIESYFLYSSSDESELEKTLVKKQPNLTIKNHIKYI